MENKQLNKLIKLAQGERTQNQYALHCGVSSSAITHVLEGKNRPSPKFLQQLADKAYNGVTFEDLMKASISPFILNDLPITATERAAGWSDTAKVSVTPIEFDMLQVFREVGKKYGEESQRAAISMLENTLGLKK